MTSPIALPNAYAPDLTETRPCLDLAVYHFRQRHGDVTVFGTWWMADADEEPCLVFIRTADYGVSPERVTPYVLLLQNAWIYDEERGSPRDAERTVIGLIDALGFAHNMPNAFRCASLIRDHLEELVKIPPRPNVNRTVTADIVMTDQETGLSTTYEVTDDV